MKLKILIYLFTIFSFLKCSSINSLNHNSVSQNDITGKWMIISAYTSYFGGRVNFYKNGIGYCYPKSDSLERYYFNYSFSKNGELTLKRWNQKDVNCDFCDVLTCYSYFNCKVEKEKFSSDVYIHIKLFTPDSVKLLLARRASINKFWSE